jgi:hypothetical protein
MKENSKMTNDFTRLDNSLVIIEDLESNSKDSKTLEKLKLIQYDSADKNSIELLEGSYVRK